MCYSHKSRKLILIIAVLALILSCSGCGPLSRLQVSFMPADFTESNAPLDNPYRGFFLLCPIKPGDETTPASQKSRVLRSLAGYEGSLVLLQINIGGYADRSIPKNALSQIDAALEAIEEEGLTAIIRPVYDWDGNAPATEPDSLSMIEDHIKSLAPVINRHKDIILAIQGCLVGSWGEMHSSKYESVEDFKRLITTLGNETDPSVFLSVRTPWQLRGINNSSLPVSEDTAFDKSLRSRLGLYNDGMFGSVSDLGTYGEAGSSPSADPASMWSREDELDFQNELCNYVPNGGEAILSDDPSLLLQDNVITDMRSMHITYLNGRHDKELIDRWKAEAYSGSGVFQGKRLYDYIASHLGYRYYIDYANVSPSPDSNSVIDVSLSVKNRGFAPCYRNFDAFIRFTPDIEDPGEAFKSSVTLPASLDPRIIKGTSCEDYTFHIPIKKLPKNRETGLIVSLGLRDPSTGGMIRFANVPDDTAVEGEVVLGRFYLTS